MKYNEDDNKSLFVDLVNSYFMINPIWRNGYERKEAMVN